jgi:hypothetical protein
MQFTKIYSLSERSRRALASRNTHLGRYRRTAHVLSRQGLGYVAGVFSQGRRGGCAASHSGGTKSRRAAASVRRRNRSVASDAMPTTRREATGTKK